MVIVVLVIIAAVILLLIYINQSRTERGLRSDFDKFIEGEFRENFYPEVIREVNLNEPIELDNRTQLIFFGVNHFQVVRSPWALYVVTSRDICHQFLPTFKGKYWIQRFTTLPERDAIKVSGQFEVQEIIWSKKETITARGFLLPHNGLQEDLTRNVHFAVQ